MKEMHAGFYFENPLDGDHLEVLGIDYMILLKCILKK
jgi:hypothetical protein